MLLEIKNVKYEIKNRILIDAEHLRIQRNDRIGLIGRNGSGKTALLEILAGVREPTNGTIISRSTIELLPQLKKFSTNKSGGEITQEYINQSLAKNTEVLLADEPTTNLDTDHIEKLKSQLTKWNGAIILVSHDRGFLDAICNQIWEINDSNITVYKGNYSDFMEQKQLKIKKQENAYQQYLKKKRQLENALEIREQKAQRATKVPKKTSSSEAKITGAKPYFAKKQKKLQQSKKSIETRLEKLSKVEKVKELPPIKMNLPHEETFKDRIVIRIEDVEGMVGDRLLWNRATFHIKGGGKIAIIGKNGVLSKLSLEPSDELEQEFQKLISQKRKVQNNRD
nr:ATP-binding cassette domain-containing protein [Oceanobacillus senegalensis]